MWRPARPCIVPNQECRDRRTRAVVALLLVWVGQRTAADTDQHVVAGTESPVRAQPCLEQLTTVELEGEQLIVAEERAGNNGRRRALVLLWCSNWGEAEHLGAQHHVHRTVERAVQRDLAEDGLGAPAHRLA